MLQTRGESSQKMHLSEMLISNGHKQLAFSGDCNSSLYYHNKPTSNLLLLFNGVLCVYIHVCAKLNEVL